MCSIVGKLMWAQKELEKWELLHECDLICILVKINLIWIIDFIIKCLRNFQSISLKTQKQSYFFKVLTTTNRIEEREQRAQLRINI